MSLEEEITLYQFAQGHYPAAELLERYNQQKESEQVDLFFTVHNLILQLKPTDADIDQLVADTSLGETTLVADVLKSSRSKTGLVRSISDGYNRVNRALLSLFKITYQRRYSTEKEATTNWRYQNLLDPAVVASVLARHRALIDEVYAHPSFRGELASMAKLWFGHVEQRQNPAPPPDKENQFDFMTYDEIVTTTIAAIDYKRMWNIRFLQNALANAFSIQYGLDTTQAERLVNDVVERHLRETFRVDRSGQPIAPGS